MTDVIDLGAARRERGLESRSPTVIDRDSSASLRAVETVHWIEEEPAIRAEPSERRLSSVTPFNSDGLPAQPSESRGSEGATGSDIDSTVGSLVLALGSHRSASLVWVTLTTSPRDDVRARLGVFLEAFAGTWGVVEERRRTGDLHAHMLVVVESSSELDRQISDWCAATGAATSGQDRRGVSGWRGFSEKGDDRALRRNLSRIVRYAGKDPSEGFATGALRAVAVTAPTYTPPTPPTVTPVTVEPYTSVTRCECGCGRRPPRGCRFFDEKHGARSRQRERQRRLRRALADSLAIEGDDAPEAIVLQTARELVQERGFREPQAGGALLAALPRVRRERAGATP